MKEQSRGLELASELVLGLERVLNWAYHPRHKSRHNSKIAQVHLSHQREYARKLAQHFPNQLEMRNYCILTQCKSYR